TSAELTELTDAAQRWERVVRELDFGGLSLSMKQDNAIPLNVRDALVNLHVFNNVAMSQCVPAYVECVSSLNIELENVPNSHMNVVRCLLERDLLEQYCLAWMLRGVRELALGGDATTT